MKKNNRPRYVPAARMHTRRFRASFIRTRRHIQTSLVETFVVICVTRNPVRETLLYRGCIRAMRNLHESLRHANEMMKQIDSRNYRKKHSRAFDYSANLQIYLYTLCISVLCKSILYQRIKVYIEGFFGKIIFVFAIWKSNPLSRFTHPPS